MKTKKINPRITFRIYPDSESKLYCHVSIWRTVSEMHLVRQKGSNYDGMCTEIQVISFRGNRERQKPVFAEMHLAMDKLTYRVTTHEVFHATLYWMRRRGITSQMAEDDMKVEEDCAYAYTQLLDNLIEQIEHNHLQVTT